MNECSIIIINILVHILTLYININWYTFSMMMMVNKSDFIMKSSIFTCIKDSIGHLVLNLAR